MFKVGEALTSREIAERLGIAFKSWENNRKKYLAHLEKFYKIKLEGYGVSRRYVFEEQIEEYEPYISPKDKQAMEKKYQDIILEKISKPGMELQLYSTMNKRVIATGEPAKFSHKDSTSYKYVSNGMKEMFGAKEGEWGSCGQFVQSIWAKQIFDGEYDFERLNEMEAKNWSAIRKKYRNDNFKFASMLEYNEISYDKASNDVMENLWFKYQCAKQEFFELYGFVPVWVKEYLVAPKSFVGF